jgi:nucleoside-diphosphate-sugar epimerase
MKILITGGAGYIGSELTREFSMLRENYDITVIDNFKFNQTSIIDLCRHSNMHFIKGDVRDERIMIPLIKESDVIIPLAAIVGKPACDVSDSDTTTTNVGTIKVLTENASKDQLIIYPNTNSGYGSAQQEEVYTELSPLNPISTYGITKCQAEDLISNGPSNFVVFRLATVFGVSTRMRMDLMVNDFVYRAVKDKFITLFEPNFKRNFVHIHDVVRAIIATIDSKLVHNQIFNHGEINASKRELCDKIKTWIPEFLISESEYNKDPDKRNYIISCEKLTLAGHVNIFTLDDGIQELIKAYQILSNERYSNI